ncbi:Na+/H+ antiporter subunit E [Streptomyces litchfieldiae]|uniref:Na+/H+ antiporter subunit E n=1 Tax=Streptomyces litchfieldiae TaxID=3075543 RepID=A0ABU2ML42_9ACTN|nr:Na+/H+ antiporter subunit E [Streptomyces sp. DSM 44938]MDT0342326.1 Na+/H+ antiporter subunit E [Streptomyces sp. DSM 44938]
MPRHRLAMLLWLWLLWILLWGSLSLLVLTGGLLVAAGTLLAFRMPPIHPGVTVRPLRLLALAAHLLADLAGSAVDVAWAAVRHGRRVPAAVVEVRLAEDSDLLIAATAYLTTMSPGSLVLEIDRDRRLLYVHGIPVAGPGGAENLRRAVRVAERGTLAAFPPVPPAPPASAKETTT